MLKRSSGLLRKLANPNNPRIINSQQSKRPDNTFRSVASGKPAGLNVIPAPRAGDEGIGNALAHSVENIGALSWNHDKVGAISRLPHNDRLIGCDRIECETAWIAHCSLPSWNLCQT